MTDEIEDNATASPAPKASRKYTVRNYIDAGKLKSDLSFSPATISDAMIQQASLFAHYGVLAAQASKQTNDIEMVLEATEAAVYRRERDNAVNRGEKPTEGNLKQLVERNKNIIALKKALNEARQVEATAKVATEAMRHRRDMLVQQGLLQREEMKGELTIRERNVRDSIHEDQRNAVLEARRNFANAG